MNDMTFINKVSYSNRNDQHDFSWICNEFTSVKKIFPLCLKILFHFKNDQVFVAYAVYYRHATDRDRVCEGGAVCLCTVLLLTVLSQRHHFCLVCSPVMKVNGQVISRYSIV